MTEPEDDDRPFRPAALERFDGMLDALQNRDAKTLAAIKNAQALIAELQARASKAERELEEAKAKCAAWKSRAERAEAERDEANVTTCEMVAIIATDKSMVEQDRDALRRDAERMRGELEHAQDEWGQMTVLANEQELRAMDAERKLAIAVGALETLAKEHEHQAMAWNDAEESEQGAYHQGLADTARRALEQIKGETT